MTDPTGWEDPDDLANDLALHGADALQPIQWDELDAEQLRTTWTDLDEWVNWLRKTYALPATVVPPLWHRHPPLQLELSALHQHWTASHHPSAHASGPHTWHRDLRETIQRLRDWTAQTGSRIDRDHAHQPTAWPGEPPGPPEPDRPITNRQSDFNEFVDQAVIQRAEGQDP